MRVDPYWIESATLGKIAIMARPRPNDWLEDELLAWQRAGVDVVVSCLTAAEIIGLGLSAESSICHAIGLAFWEFPIVDRAVPQSKTATLDVVRHLSKQMRAGRNIAIHCRMGIGRAALMCACVLIALGEDCDEVFAAVESARGLAVPDTAEQVAWVHKLAPQLALLE